MNNKSILLAIALLAVSSLGLRAETSVAVTKFDEKPVPVYTVMPEAPRGESGTVAVICVVDETGKVVDVSVKNSTNPALEEPALEALRNWSFAPAKIASKAVKAKVVVPLHFGA